VAILANNAGHFPGQGFHRGLLLRQVQVMVVSLALATCRAACERWPGTPITLRQGRACDRRQSADANHRLV
jgi:hypothetical protein